MTDDLRALLKQVKRIELRSRRAVDALAQGGYRSRFKGQGMDFEEVREYSPGDDVRHIDWNVTARAGHPFVKVFREERELTAMLLVDVSASMHWGAVPGISARDKMAAAAEAAAVVAVTALHNGDQIGLVCFSDQTEVHVPPRKGRGHVLRLVRDILATQPRHGAGTKVVAALEELARHRTKRALCCIVSDFLGEGEDLAAALTRSARHHDVIGLRVCDPAEGKLPAVNAVLPLRDPETGQEMALRLDRAGRERYQAAWNHARAATETAFRRAGCDLVDFSTTDNVMAAVQRFFARRRRSVRA